MFDKAYKILWQINRSPNVSAASLAIIHHEVKQFQSSWIGASSQLLFTDVFRIWPAMRGKRIQRFILQSRTGSLSKLFLDISLTAFLRIFSSSSLPCVMIKSLGHHPTKCHSKAAGQRRLCEKAREAARGLESAHAGGRHLQLDARLAKGLLCVREQPDRCAADCCSVESVVHA